MQGYRGSLCTREIMRLACTTHRAHFPAKPGRRQRLGTGFTELTALAKAWSQPGLEKGFENTPRCGAGQGGLT